MVNRAVWSFDANASYIVAGGLGGLGRAIIKWMVGRGARHLILPSRSGPASKSAVDVVDELRQKGINLLTPCCDVSSIEDLSAALTSAALAGFPKIKGCINAAMDLQVCVILALLGR